MRSAVLAALVLASGCWSTSDPMVPRLEPAPTASVAEPPTDPAACLHDGEEAPASGTAIPCCDGLGRVPVYKGSVIRFDQCLPVTDGRTTCVRCGDGHCGVGETVCNCPGDCG